MGLISSRGRILTPLARHDHAPQIYLGRLSSISTSTHVPAARWMDITLDFNWHIGHKRSSTQVSAYHFCIGGVGPLTLTTMGWMIEFMGIRSSYEWLSGKSDSCAAWMIMPASVVESGK